MKTYKYLQKQGNVFTFSNHIPYYGECILIKGMILDEGSKSFFVEGEKIYCEKEDHLIFKEVELKDIDIHNIIHLGKTRKTIFGNVVLKFCESVVYKTGENVSYEIYKVKTIKIDEKRDEMVVEN